MIGRTGGALLLLGGAAAAIVGVAQQGAWSLGGLTPELLVLALVGAGALLIALAGRTPFERCVARVALGLTGIGALGLVGAGVRAASVYLGSDSLGVVLLLGGFLGLVFGLVLAVVALVPRPDSQRWIGISLLVGLLAVIPGTALIDARLSIVGFGFILFGLALVGLIALGGGPIHARRTRSPESPGPIR